MRSSLRGVLGLLGYGRLQHHPRFNEVICVECRSPLPTPSSVTVQQPTHHIIRMSFRSLQFPARRALLSQPSLHYRQPRLRRNYVLGKPPYPQIEPFSPWPFAAILAAGTCLYVLMVKRRAAEAPQKPRQKNTSSSSSPS